MTANDLDLLAQFARARSQDAFTELVSRNLNLVYSAALRQVRSPELAEEVSQTVFTHLARHAAKLKPDTVLSAWLYQVTRHEAIDVVRREARRQAREQIAFQMSDTHDNSAGWTHIEPMLDEAMQSLNDADRAAILLRYFENKSLREVGDALGASEDAAQKRVGRAVERLREYLSKNGVAVGTGGLVSLLSANAVQAAPTGLAVSIATGAALASASASLSTSIAATKIIAMTTIQKTIIAGVIAVAVAAGVYQARQVSTLRAQVKILEQQRPPIDTLSNQVAELQRERDAATNRLAALSSENAALKKNPNEVLKLRGEVGRLRKENTAIGSSNALSKITANAESRKMLRDQQKTGMSMIYKTFAANLKLTPEQTDKFNELLADHIMENVDHVTTVLRDKPSPEQMDQMFAAQDAILHEQLQELVGQDGLAKYQDYTKNLIGTISAEQFKSMLGGSGAEKQEKTKQLRQVIQEETLAALTSAGLPADYQAVPMLNFRNIASESEGEKSLKLMDDIYQRAASRGAAFLSEEDLKKFQEFRALALKNSRSAIMVNRAVMAPIAN